MKITFDTFIEIVEECTSPEEFYKRAQVIKDIPPEVSTQFFNEYGDGGKLSPIEACNRFYQAHHSLGDNEELFDADPDCDHNIVMRSSGYGCTKCGGWYCA